MSAPALIVRFELERGPVVHVDSLTQGEEARMVDWLQAHPEWVDLVIRAQELEAEARAA